MLEHMSRRRGQVRGIAEVWHFLSNSVPSVIADSLHCQGLSSTLLFSLAQFTSCRVRNLTPVNIFILLQNVPKWILYDSLEYVSVFMGYSSEMSV